MFERKLNIPSTAVHTNTTPPLPPMRGGHGVCTVNCLARPVVINVPKWKASSCNHGNAAKPSLSDTNPGPTQDVYVHMAGVREDLTHILLCPVVSNLYG